MCRHFEILSHVGDMLVVACAQPHFPRIFHNYDVVVQGYDLKSHIYDFLSSRFISLISVPKNSPFGTFDALFCYFHCMSI